MIWNHILQAVFGYLTRDALLWSRNGILLCAITTLVVQGIDTFRFYVSLRNRFASDFVSVEDGSIAWFQRGALYKFSQLFIFKVIWYFGITMAVAAIARSVASVEDRGYAMDVVVVIIVAALLLHFLFRGWSRNTELRRYQQSAEAGDAEAQFEMGVLHQYGRGVPQDFGKAVALYRKAAERGHVEAQSNLGTLYASGQGIPRDYGEALRWFTRAAQQGNAFAQNNLCRLYSFGEGVPQDYVKAYMWLELAICGLEGPQKEKAVMNRDRFLASHMNPAEIKRAKKMVQEWKASHSY